VPVALGELSGYVVGVTADRRADEQVAMLERRGAAVVHGRVIRTHPFAVDGPLATALRDLVRRPPEITVLSTGIGVRGIVEAAECLDLAEPLVDALAGSRVHARGPKANGAAVTAGIPVHWQTPSGLSHEIVAELARLDGGRRGIAGRRVAVQLDGAETQPLARALEDLGAEVVAIPVYRWSLPDDTGPALRLVQAVAERRVDAVTFTARPQVECLCEIAEGAGLLDALRAAFARSVIAACVGPVCADAAVEAGFGSPVVPVRSRLGSMVARLAEVLAERSVAFELAGETVLLRGRVLEVSGDRLALSERERDLLAALADRPGRVLSKSQLLAAAWPQEQADEHAVEVAVARLRRRLGARSHLLETVFRRGYRLAAA
jgi:uroporphyrinogen-III synthase